MNANRIDREHRRVPTDGAVEIVEVQSDRQVEQAAALMREFVSWCRDRYGVRPWQVTMYFQEAEWEQELQSLGQKYAPPAGAILLALVDGRPAGCIALRTIGDGIGEMKRLFIRAGHQGYGLGRGLSEAIIDLARRRSFRTMRLETGDLQPEAMSLYRSLGFKEIEPYYDCPEPLRRHLIFMERELEPS
jgi:GNAT superfamily N-acetyltransferase